MAGMCSRARVPPCSLETMCLFHPAELFPMISFSLACSVPLQPDPLWGLGSGGEGDGFRSLPYHDPLPVSSGIE